MVTIRTSDLEVYGDGRTPCEEVFSHVAQALADAGGGVFEIGEGDWLLNETVRFNWDNIRLVGTGRGTKIINGTEAGSAIHLGADKAEDACSGCAVELMAFAQAENTTAKTGNRPLTVTHVGKSFFDRLECTPYPNRLYDAFLFDHVAQSTVNHVAGSDTLNNGITFRRCLDIGGQENRVDATGGIGFRFIACEGFHPNAWKAYGNKRNAWRFEAEDGIANVHFFLSGCVGDTSGEDNWWIDNIYDMHLTACWGSAHLDTTVNPQARGFVVGSNARSVRLVSIGALACNGNGIEILAGADDIQFVLPTLGSPYPKGRGNGKGGKGGYGLRVHKLATNVVVLGGSVRGNASGSILGNASTIIRDVIGYSLAKT